MTIKQNDEVNLFGRGTIRNYGDGRPHKRISPDELQKESEIREMNNIVKDSKDKKLQWLF